MTRLAKSARPESELSSEATATLGHELCEMSFRSYCREHAPDFKLLESRISFESIGFAQEATIDLLHRAPHLVGLYVAGGGMEGVIAALRDRGAGDHITTVCNELIPQTRTALIEGSSIS